LAPGERIQVSFTITADKLKFYDINMQEMVVPGDFTIMPAPSSQMYETVKRTAAK
jgi:beta-glucosidase